MKHVQRYWKITGWKSTAKIFESRVKYGCLGENKIKELLRALAAKHGLSDQEIVSSYARSNTKGATPLLLDVRIATKPYAITCGINPYFTARVIEEEKE